MLVQTAEHRHYRDLPQGQWWPHDAQAQWWKRARRQNAKERELSAARCLDRWRNHASFELLGSLFGPEQHGFIEFTQLRACPLDLVSVAPKAAFSSVMRLRRGFDSTWATVRRADNSATANIGFAGDRTDANAIAAHCGSTAGTVTSWADQGTLANDMPAPSPTGEPTIWTGSSLKTTAGGQPALSFDGSNDAFRRAGTLGITGNGPITALLVFKALTNVTSAVYWGMGQFGTGGPNAQEMQQVSSATLIDFQNNLQDAIFNCSTVLTENFTLAINPGTGTTATYIMRQNGIALGINSLTTGTLSLGTQWTTLGCHLSLTRFVSMLCTCWVVWNASLSDADIVAAEEIGRLHVA